MANINSKIINLAIFSPQWYDDAKNEILDLQRDPPANDLVLREKYTFDI